jgi:two-component SAPR family response regulator
MQTPTTATLAAGCLGEFWVTVQGRPIRRWRAGKARNLFQYLLVNRDRVIAADRLCDVLWPGAELARHSSSLKVAVHGLRQALMPAPGASQQIAIIRGDSGYALRATNLWTDFDEFEAAFRDGRRAELSGDTAGAVRAYRRAMTAYTGDFLPGETLPWTDEQRQWLRATALRAVTYLRDVAVRENDYPAILDASRRILDLDPCHEETYRVLMIMHGRLGEKAQVRSWHERCIQRLRERLDLSPTPLTQRVLASALRGDV